MTTPLPRRAHPAGSRRRPGSTSVCPVCITTLAAGPGFCICPSCRVVLTGRPGNWTVDAGATRDEMFAAAEACAHGDSLLQAAVSMEPVHPVLALAYRRLELAETGLVTLARLSL